MRKILVLLCLLGGLMLAQAQTDNGWRKWEQTNCYTKVTFRLKYAGKHGAQHHWQVQFKNDYPSIISFNYHITDKLQQYNITTHRKTLYADKVSDVIDVYTKEEDIFLLVDKLSLSPYPENFLDCDH